jgi:hypothetical protein
MWPGRRCPLDFYNAQMATPSRSLTMQEIIAMYPAGSAKARFWEQEAALREQSRVGDEYWADSVTRLKREKKYAEAVAVCRRVPPYPARYSELLVCLRHVIRENRKAGTDYSGLLTELYACAVESAAICTPPTVTTTRPIGNKSEPDTYPGFNAARIYIALVSRHGVPLEYQSVGYAKVSSLNQTDRKWLVEAWGEPQQHVDPCNSNAALWEAARELFTREMEAQEDQSRREWAEIVGKALPTSSTSITPQPPQSPPPSRRWWWPFS